MKKLVLLCFLLFAGMTYAQEGVSVKGNTVSMKDMPPVWPGCENSEQSSKACFQQKLIEHLKANYKYPRDENGKIIRGKTVVSFNINEEGKPEILSVEGPKKELNAEAKKIIMAIPQMEPGHRGGKPVAIKYKVPFTF